MERKSKNGEKSRNSSVFVVICSFSCYYKVNYIEEKMVCLFELTEFSESNHEVFSHFLFLVRLYPKKFFFVPNEYKRSKARIPI